MANKNNKNNLIKKFSLVLMFILTLNIGFSINLITDQDKTINMYHNLEKNNMIQDYVSIAQTHQINNESYQYLRSFDQITNNIYYVYPNNQNGTKITFRLDCKTSDNHLLVTKQTIEMLEIGEYYYVLEPTYKYEKCDVYFNINNSQTLNIIYQTQELYSSQDKSIFTPLIAGATDLITINITIWKLLFYGLIVIVIIVVIRGVIYYVMKFYNWTGEHKLFRKNHR